MKTMIAIAAILIALEPSHHHVALAQHVRATTPPAPEAAPKAGVAPPPLNEPADAPATGGGGFGGGGSAGGVFDGPRVTGGRYSANTLRYAQHGAPAGFPTTVHFSQPDPKSEDALLEDLNVMSLLLQKKLEEAVGENSPTYGMGIPLLLRSGQRSVESLYLDGFGVLFTVNVNFPLVAPPSNRMKDKEDATISDDWNQARKELYGGRETRESANAFGSGTVPYDADQVAALKKALLETLKNAANIRDLQSDESVVIAVFGSESVAAARGESGGTTGGSAGFGGGSGTTPGVVPDNRGGVAFPVTAYRNAQGVIGMGDLNAAYQRYVRGESSHGAGRGTVLTVRVKKSAAEAFAKGEMSLEQFQQKTTVNAYIGAARPGAAWHDASSPRVYDYQWAPVAR